MSDNPFTHAGGVVYTLRDGQPVYLVITSRKNPNHWVLPKGHIEAEDIKTAAVREVREETGVEARIISVAGSSRYSVVDEKIYVRFYLMELVGKGNPARGENRVMRWCGCQEAIALLSFPNLKRILGQAHLRLEKIINRE